MDEVLTKLLSERNKLFFQRCQEQIPAFSNALAQSQLRSLISETNSIPMPEYSGDPNEDVKGFLRQFNGIASFYKYSNEEKAKMLPLLLTGNAPVWRNSIRDLATMNFEELYEALLKQFHSEADIFRLRLLLFDRKQLPGERVSQFASEIRKFCLRLDMSIEDKHSSFCERPSSRAKK